MKKLILAVLAVVLLVGCTTTAPVDDSPATDILCPPGYILVDGDCVPNDSSLIGRWQGYAIAVTQMVVITDVQDDMITFYFNNISSIDSEFDTTTDEMTLQIVNNQITAPNEIMAESGEMISQEITLTFYDDHIRYEIDGLDDIWWTLVPTVLEGEN